MAKRHRRPSAPTAKTTVQHGQRLPAVTTTPSCAPPPEPLEIGVLIAAIEFGVLDDHLARLGAAINNRYANLQRAEELIASSHLHVGDRMQLGHNLRPLYLHGRAVTVVEKDGDRWIVRLDEPVGRFADGDLRVSSTQLDPLDEV
jgi:hypothetical protein